MTNTRIQLSRSRGWRLPTGAKSVARPTRYGNPFRVGTTLVRYGPGHTARFGRPWDYEGRLSSDGMRHDMWFAPDDVIETHVRTATQAECVELYRLTVTNPTPGMRMAYPSTGGRFVRADLGELAGLDLACWCDLAAPCHADVILDVLSGRSS